MALTACRECGKEVSRSAPTCPNCGIKKPGKQWYDVDIKMGGCGGCLAVLVVVWLIIVGLGQIDTSSLKDSPSTPRVSSAYPESFFEALPLTQDRRQSQVHYFNSRRSRYSKSVICLIEAKLGSGNSMTSVVSGVQPHDLSVGAFGMSTNQRTFICCL